MDYETAAKLLLESGHKEQDDYYTSKPVPGSLGYGDWAYLEYFPGRGMCLDGHFSLEQMEALTAWMRHWEAKQEQSS